MTARVPCLEAPASLKFGFSPVMAGDAGGILGGRARCPVPHSALLSRKADGKAPATTELPPEYLTSPLSQQSQVRPRGPPPALLAGPRSPAGPPAAAPQAGRDSPAGGGGAAAGPGAVPVGGRREGEDGEWGGGTKAAPSWGAGEVPLDVWGGPAMPMLPVGHTLPGSSAETEVGLHSIPQGGAHARDLVRTPRQQPVHVPCGESPAALRPHTGWVPPVGEGERCPGRTAPGPLASLLSAPGWGPLRGEPSRLFTLSAGA